MKGVILAGGLGTRLYPLTKITNKHLLPVYDRPMIFYPLYTLVEAGIKEVLLVTGGNFAGEFLRLLGDGRKLGLDLLAYAYQEKERGIADALWLAKDFVQDDTVVVILGDNILDGSIKRFVQSYRKGRAKILLKEVDNPSEYGVPRFEADRIVEIVEKPANPPSRYAVMGVYIYPATVFEIIAGLQPSSRGELEISDVNDRYAKEGLLDYEIWDGWWGDAGSSIASYWEVNKYVERRKRDDPTAWELPEFVAYFEDLRNNSR